MVVSLTEVGNESTVDTIVNNHISHVHKKYKDTVVFSDGYGETLSTKHHEHARKDGFSWLEYCTKYTNIMWQGYFF